MNGKFLNVSLTLMIFFSMVSCEKENVNEPMMDEPVRVTNAEMQRAAEVVAEMVGENAEYFSYIDAAVRDESLEYMEDRVLFRDLLSAGVETKSASVLPFAEDFARLAESGDAMTKSGGEQMDAEKLMAYLRDNNISIYCPFPLEDYAEDNRIPAICTIVSDNLDSLPGVQYHADGTFEDVIVSQAYADEHPVWIIRHEDGYIFDALNVRNNDGGVARQTSLGGTVVVKPKIAHYEMSIAQIYCQQYMGGIGEGDLDIRLCFCATNPKYSQADECFVGYFDNIIPVQMPRKYVGWAKNGWDKGWFDVGCVFDTDWKTTEYQQYFAAYDYDKKYGVNMSATLKGTYKASAAEAAAEAKIGLEYKTKDDLMGLMQWDRTWVFDNVLKGGGATWTDDQNRTIKTDMKGNYLIKPSTYFWVSVKCNTYYSDMTYPGIGGGTIVAPGGTVVGRNYN